jgi:hypothetical protein
MAGALYAIHRRRRLQGELEPKGGKLFDIIYTSGAGALIGLLLAAPKVQDPEKALKSILDLAVSDPIYSMLPINYKAFFKPGPFTRPFQRMAQLYKLGEYPFQPIKEPSSPLGQWYNYWANVGKAWVNHSEANRRLFNDLIDLWTAAITPTTLTFMSQGFCEPLPFIEDFVDFERLRKENSDFFLNFYTDRDLREQNKLRKPGTQQYPRTAAGKVQSGTGVAMRLFRSGQIKPEHVRAAFAYPLVYEPVRIPPEDGDLAFEGANWEPISFGNLLHPQTGLITQGLRVKTVVLIDIVSMLEPFMLREPRNLWDAFGLLIIFPVVAHARKELARFESELVRVGKEWVHQDHRFTYHKIQFDIDDEDAEHILDWSYSNMSRMFDKGCEAGEKFCLEHGDDL